MLTRSEIAPSPEQVSFFRESGYLVLKGVLAPWELRSLDEGTRRIIDGCRDASPLTEDYQFSLDPLTGHNVLRRINSLYLKDERFFALWANPRLAGAAAALLGPDVICRADALVVKMPEYGAPVRWHRDPAHPRVQPHINLGVYLDAATPANGCLYVVPGSHLWQGFDLHDMLDEHGFDLPGAIPVYTEPGDVIIHSVNVLHGSRTTHNTPGMRRVIYVAYSSIQEMRARGGDVPYVRAFQRVLLKAIAVRAAMPEAASETPFAYQPTLPEFQVEPGDPGFVDLRLRRLSDNYDPNYAYSPLVTVTPKI